MQPKRKLNKTKNTCHFRGSLPSAAKHEGCVVGLTGKRPECGLHGVSHGKSWDFLDGEEMLKSVHLETDFILQDGLLVWNRETIYW